MRKICKKISNFMKTVFGYGIMICLFAGGITFFGYVAAVIIGSETAALICDIIYNKINPVIIYASSVLILWGLIAMYLGGEKALTTKVKRDKTQDEK